MGSAITFGEKHEIAVLSEDLEIVAGTRYPYYSYLRNEKHHLMKLFPYLPCLSAQYGRKRRDSDSQWKTGGCGPFSAVWHERQYEN